MPPKRTTQTKFPNDELSEEMYKKQMEKRIASLQDDLDKEQKERNKFQIERDRIQTFWEITKREVEEKKYELSVKQREMEEAEERHQQEMKVYKQKVKNILYEHQNSLSELKTESAVSSKLLQTEHAELRDELRDDLRRLKDELKEHQQSTEKLIKNFQLKHVVEKTKLINDFARQTQEIESKYKQKYKELHQWEELRHKTEIQEFKERKNMHLNTLIKNHEKALKEMRDYFYDIIQKNRNLITSLQEELKETKMRETQARKEMVKLLQENNKLTESQQGD